MNLRDWLNLGRPAIPGRRIILEPTSPISAPLCCATCGRPLVAAEARFCAPGEWQMQRTLDACSFRCALAIVQQEDMDADSPAS